MIDTVQSSEGPEGARRGDGKVVNAEVQVTGGGGNQSENVKYG